MHRSYKCVCGGGGVWLYVVSCAAGHKTRSNGEREHKIPAPKRWNKGMDENASKLRVDRETYAKHCMNWIRPNITDTSTVIHTVVVVPLGNSIKATMWVVRQHWLTVFYISGSALRKQCDVIKFRRCPNVTDTFGLLLAGYISEAVYLTEAMWPALQIVKFMNLMLQ